MKKFMLVCALLCLLPAPARAATQSEQRAETQKMHAATLTKLYQLQSEVSVEIDRAAGYAVFSSTDVAALFVSGSYGHGLAHNNRTGQESYMQMAAAGMGLGLGVKDFRTVFIFDTADAFHDFVNAGLELSTHADIAVQQEGKGGSLSEARDVIPGVKVYRITETSLLVQIMLRGTKYWRDSDLNEYKQIRRGAAYDEASIAPSTNNNWPHL